MSLVRAGYLLAVLLAVGVAGVSLVPLAEGSVLRKVGGVGAVFNGLIIGRFSIPLLVHRVRNRLTDDEWLWVAGSRIWWFYGILAAQACSVGAAVAGDSLLALATVAFAVVLATVTIAYE